jgi:hypothetical protein
MRVVFVQLAHSDCVLCALCCGSSDGPHGAAPGPRGKSFAVHTERASPTWLDYCSCVCASLSMHDASVQLVTTELLE